MLSKKILLISAVAGALVSFAPSAMAQGYYGPPGYFPRPHFSMTFGYRPRPTYYVPPGYFRPPVYGGSEPVVLVPSTGCDPTYGCASAQQPMTGEEIDVERIRIKRTYRSE